jgi:hypothetical protein
LPTNQKRSLLVSKVWIQAAIIVFLIGFLILGLLAYRTYVKTHLRQVLRAS